MTEREMQLQAQVEQLQLQLAHQERVQHMYGQAAPAPVYFTGGDPISAMMQPFSHATAPYGGDGTSSSGGIASVAGDLAG